MQRSDVGIEEILAASQRVCARVSEGALLRECLEAENISALTWWRWQEEITEIRSDFMRARIAQAHSLAERAVVVSAAVKGEDHHIVQAVRLEVDTLRWYTSKIAPKLYGDQLQVNGDGFRIGVIALPAESVTLPSTAAPPDVKRIAAPSDAESLGPESET